MDVSGGVEGGGEDLDALAREAQHLDAAPELAQAAQAGQDALAVQNNNAAELLAGLHMARELALPILPKDKGAMLAQVWSDDVLGRVANAGGAVLTLHGQSVGDLIGRYAPYIVLLGALIRPVLETREILKVPSPAPVKKVQIDPEQDEAERRG